MTTQHTSHHLFVFNTYIITSLLRLNSPGNLTKAQEQYEEWHDAPLLPTKYKMIQCVVLAGLSLVPLLAKSALIIFMDMDDHYEPILYSSMD